MATLKHLTLTVKCDSGDNPLPAPLSFQRMVLTKGVVELRFITRVDLRNGVRFGSGDLACMATACPALSDLRLGDTDEEFMLMYGVDNSMTPTDDDVLQQLEVGWVGVFISVGEAELPCPLILMDIRRA